MLINPHIVILAAGMGKRMRSETPKVLHEVLFRPMIHYVLDLAYALPHQSVSIVVGHGEKEVRELCAGYENLQFFTQKEQKGTADAIKAVEPFLSGHEGRVVILSGDVILLSKETLATLLETHSTHEAKGSLITAILENPSGYGRIVREGQNVIGIREHADCSDEERKIQEVNAGIYCFDIKSLFSSLSQIGSSNRQGEFYLTDVIAGLVSQKHPVKAVQLKDPMEMTGINDREALWEVEALLQAKTNRELMRNGVTLKDPRTIYIDARCRIESDVTIEPGCRIVDSTLKKGVVIESHCRIVKCEILEEALIKQGSYLEESHVGNLATVGPYAHLRPGSRLESAVKIGNFVEVKKSTIGAGSKASHLSYIGDAEIGRNVNLGCGFITCNYDGGPEKRRTVIEDDVFVGSDSQVVAPVRIGKGSYVASGTTLTHDVPPDSLALSRVKQVNKIGYASRLKRSKNSAPKKS